MLMLYRSGNTHIVRGIECEAKRFRNGSLKALLAQGWQLTPEETQAESAPETTEAAAAAVEPVKAKKRGRPRKAAANGN